MGCKGQIGGADIVGNSVNSEKKLKIFDAPELA